MTYILIFSTGPLVSTLRSSAATASGWLTLFCTRNRKKLPWLIPSKKNIQISTLFTQFLRIIGKSKLRPQDRARLPVSRLLAYVSQLLAIASYLPYRHLSDINLLM